MIYFLMHETEKMALFEYENQGITAVVSIKIQQTDCLFLKYPQKQLRIRLPNGL